MEMETAHVLALKGKTTNIVPKKEYTLEQIAGRKLLKV